MFNNHWMESEHCGLLSETDYVYPFPSTKRHNGIEREAGAVHIIRYLPHGEIS